MGMQELGERALDGKTSRENAASSWIWPAEEVERSGSWRRRSPDRYMRGMGKQPWRSTWGVLWCRRRRRAAYKRDSMRQSGARRRICLVEGGARMAASLIFTSGPELGGASTRAIHV
jgi:hypothetical protein